MKTHKLTLRSLLVTLALFGASLSYAGLPFNSIEGPGGAAFNPFAYTAGTPWGDKDSTASDNTLDPAHIFSKPQVGIWYTSLGDVNVDWSSFGVAETLFDRVELSYSHEIIAPSGGDNLKKDNFGVKGLIIKENQWDKNYVPAVAVGAILKKTDGVAPGVDDSGSDFYLVATKLIKETPKPLLVSGGLLSTDGQTLGVFGYNHDRDLVGFANADVVLNDKLAVGAEFRQGARFDDFKNANYWDAHVIFFPNKNISIIGAYVNAGDENSTSKVGLGDGFVLSTQLQF
jgi:hypothetical protein